MSNGSQQSLVKALPDLPKSWRGRPFGCAVSGGSDSMALLLVLARRYPELVCAVTVDHGLREQSLSEAEAVGAFCTHLGITHTILHWRWDHRANLASAARTGRYHAMGQWARDNDLAGLALGHTSDDIAETFAMRVERAAGLAGLSAMSSHFFRAGTHWWRPFLTKTRVELQQYLTDNGVEWTTDPSNHDLRYDRARVRAVFNTFGVEPKAIAQSALALRQANDALVHYARRDAAHYVREDRGDLLIDRRASVPAEIHRRWLVAGLRWVGGGNYPPRQKALEMLEKKLVNGKTHTLAGCLVSSVTPGVWRIGREPNALTSQISDLDNVWDGRWVIFGADRGYVGALGSAGLAHFPEWRKTGLPRSSLIASPAIWLEDKLLAAPLLEQSKTITAKAHARGSFLHFLSLH